jgi:hypothetical protein
VINYKSDKRQITEQRASVRIKDTLQKHVFRNKVARSIRGRNIMLKHLYNRIFINRIGKLLLCMTLQKRVVSQAFDIARKTINNRAAWNV